MKLSFVAMLVCCSLVAGAARSQEPTPEAIGREYLELPGLGLEEFVRRGRTMEPRLKQAVMNYYRYMAEESGPGNVRTHYEGRLFSLGDEAMVERYGQEYLRNQEFDNVGLFPTCQNPRVIELIAPVIFREEGWVTRDRIEAPSISTSELILYMLARTPGFKGEVIDWAQRLPSQVETLVDVREVMREWWRENERFFKERNYQAVKPGRDLVKEERPAEPPPPSEALANNLSETRDHPSPARAVAAESSASSTGLLVTVAVAVAALALLAGLLFFRKERL